MEVGLGSIGTQLPQKKRKHSTQFLAHVYCGQTAGWMKTPLGTGVDIVIGNLVLDEIPAVRERGTAHTPLFAHVYCGHGHPSQLRLSSYSLIL